MTELFKYLNRTSTASILAILWTILAGAIFLIVLLCPTVVAPTMLSLLLQGLFSVVNYIIGYYHGNSQAQKNGNGGYVEPSATKNTE